jgi:hypothetical protein
MAIGGGQYTIVLLAMIGAMAILWVFPQIEAWIYNWREMRTYEIVCDIDRQRLKSLEEMVRACDLRVKGHKLVKQDHVMVCIIDAYGSPANHERAMEKLFAEEDIKEFRY